MLMIKKLHEIMASWSPRCILHYAEWIICGIILV